MRRKHNVAARPLERAGAAASAQAADGKARRQTTPRAMHADPGVVVSGRDVVALLQASNQDRLKQLIPVRHSRMLESPFAFFRGSAVVQAADLAGTPASGIVVQTCGDCHLMNFGGFSSPERKLVFDIIDFDETFPAPWEWDLKRLAASVNVAGRENGLDSRERAGAVKRCVSGYRFNVHRLQDMGVLDVWYLHAYPGRDNPIVKSDPKSRAVFKKTLAKALRTDNRTLMPKVADRKSDGNWCFRDDPPVLTTVDSKTRDKVIRALDRYSQSLSPERRFMLGRYHVADVAHRVVGVGSVGTRAYMVLLFGTSDDDPLFLQVKEAIAAAHAPFVPPPLPGFEHNGKRVVVGHRALQASSDPMLGYTEMDGRDYYVRQMKNLKASVPVEFLTGETFNFYAWVCGAILARAHARTGDPARVAGYCGNSAVLDEAFAEWEESYGDQTERDHAALVKAIQEGKIKADLTASAD